eukprot:750939-Hanusia_phi.AAC.6
MSNSGAIVISDEEANKDRMAVYRQNIRNILKSASSCRGSNRSRTHVKSRESSCHVERCRKSEEVMSKSERSNEPDRFDLTNRNFSIESPPTHSFRRVRPVPVSDESQESASQPQSLTLNAPSSSHSMRQKLAYTERAKENTSNSETVITTVQNRSRTDEPFKIFAYSARGNSHQVPDT